MSETVLIIGDIHEPVAHPGYLSFCLDVANQVNPDKVMFIGDVVDHHACSFHAKHPRCPGPADELEQMRAGVQKWHKYFPKATVCIGNHDERPERLAAAAGIVGDWLRTYNKVFGTSGWQWVEDTIIDDVYYHHGTGFSGMHPAYNCMRNMGMSCVQGHTHTNFGVKYMANPKRLMFGMDVGCGVDREAMAMAYGKHLKRKPVLGCGVVHSAECAYTVPMNISRGSTYHRSKHNG